METWKYWETQDVKYDYHEEIKVRTGSHKKKFIVDIDEEDADIVVERPASIEDPKVSKEWRHCNHSGCSVTQIIDYQN